MLSLNRVFLIGNLVDNPRELRTTGSGAKVTDFRMAVNDPSRKRDDKSNDNTLFIDITAWNRTAELVTQYLKRGSGVMIEGRLVPDNYTTKDGEKRSKIVVWADRVQFMPKRDGGPGGSSSGASDEAGFDDMPDAGSSAIPQPNSYSAAPTGPASSASSGSTPRPSASRQSPASPGPLKDFGLDDGGDDVPF